ncbi:MAG TPA: hypothetical protein VMF31_04735 [Solirubrobacterales bacterium]|nr:hypothetical protein [Solirubrobacterales bacterium]
MAGGEPRIVRDGAFGDLGSPGRVQRRRSLLYFAHLTDAQVADEESPARVESLDRLDSGIFRVAWRPQEAFAPFLLDAANRRVRQLRRSPSVSSGGARARMSLLATTGDMIDSKQRNELVWLRNLLEGRRVEPDSGKDGQQGCSAAADTDGSGYSGVQDHDDPPADPHFYDPADLRGAWDEAGWPAYPGLMERAQRPFRATGPGVPSYLLFANHETLVQGETAAIRQFEDLVTGCLKPRGFDAVSHVMSGGDPAGLADFDDVMRVEPDLGRRFVDKAQFQAVLAEGRQRDAHGFGLVDPGERRASRGTAGYYTWTPRPGVRMVALDVAPEGASVGNGGAGNIDDPQWRWLRRVLSGADRRRELVIVLSGSRLDGLDGTRPDEAAPPCVGTLRFGHDLDPGCDLDSRLSSPLHGGEELRALLLRHPAVVAYLTGGEHRAVPVRSANEKRGFWAITTAGFAEYPHQGRVLELMDNRDGTLSIVGTVFDIAAPVVAAAPGTKARKLDPAGVAAVARTISRNDPQADLEWYLGKPQDRNVELLLPDPRR